ncbi:hypothetical protein [Ruminococcus sp.]|uniref:hypothetical protein n=1 Tax=Ruminococcus sp. TaxID=41978 RepID=UPI003522E25A
MYKKNCKRCGNDFISLSAKARYCPACVPVIKLRSLKSKNKELNRACTDDTEFLVSIYTARGESQSRIASDLGRSEENVLKILNEAKESGRYYEHIERHIAYAGDTRKIKEEICKE